MNEVSTTTIKDAVVSGLTSVGADLTSTLTSVLPIALGIVGGVMVITFGVKLFKKLTGKA